MKRMGQYCKAYRVTDFEKFPGWGEKAIRKSETETNASSIDRERTEGEEAFYFLQEDYTVTEGIFMDERMVFDDVTPNWVDFCTQTLKFSKPTTLQSAAQSVGVRR